MIPMRRCLNYPHETQSWHVERIDDKQTTPFCRAPIAVTRQFELTDEMCIAKSAQPAGGAG